MDRTVQFSSERSQVRLSVFGAQQHPTICWERLRLLLLLRLLLQLLRLLLRDGGAATSAAAAAAAAAAAPAAAGRLCLASLIRFCLRTKLSETLWPVPNETKYHIKTRNLATFPREPTESAGPTRHIIIRAQPTVAASV